MAGATHAVNPQLIGGRRLAVFALQPDVAEFLDVVMHEENLDFRIQQVMVEPGSPLDGRALTDLDLREHTWGWSWRSVPPRADRWSRTLPRAPWCLPAQS